MPREVFKPVFEEDESVIMQRMLDRVSDTWRKDQGDFMYDAIAPAAGEFKRLQAKQDETLKSSFAVYAEGADLDKKLGEIGLERNQATPNIRRLSITADTGVRIPAGHTVSAVIQDADGNPLEYITNAETVFNTEGTLNVDITAVVAGTQGNLATGTQFILIPPLPGVRAISDQGTLKAGTDTESDESAYAKYEHSLHNPDTGGNKHDYVRWAKEVDGVGEAQTVPRWNGNGTVKVVIIGADFQPDSGPLTAEVQNYLDPGSRGLGEGKAPLGAAVTVVSATAKAINVTATVTYAPGQVPDEVRAAFISSINDYLKSLIFTQQPVIYNKIGSLLIGTAGVLNYSNLSVNGGTEDILVDSEEVAVIGTITI